ncbi:toll/interleukin-1 receptor domain-containing protein [Pseudomonas putida]|uniref:toll/interleukin-1 receptor domain-containing protein n=1 Tax=Pseudomonas putida TaxID=303 RepID=UPI00035DEBB9|nr:toll/interleukin-1 receptor domain-containing protein [Pseudomonas putida]ANC81811.1 toll-Interleukin receptor [Pseudomonas putida B6-2]
MSYFTQAEARKIGRQAIGVSRNAIDAIKGAKKNYKVKEQFDIFLSHAMVDAELVLGIKVLLEKEGKKVYVDWIDDQDMERNHVTAETAQVLRARMRQSENLLYLATENAPKSKWMPWELGYFDGYKNGGVAVLPVMDESDSPFEGQEYLGLYPVVTKEMVIQGSSSTAQGRGSRRPYGSPVNVGSPYTVDLPDFPIRGPRIFF